jgi:hypothetical protein
MSYYSRNSRLSLSSPRRGAGLGAIAAVLLILFAVGFSFAQNVNRQVRTCTVEDKDRTTGYKGKSDMRVYTTNCGVLKVSDSLINGHFNSADTYSQIQKGHTYRFTTVGYRFPLFSQFPNILEAHEVSP